MNMEITIWKLIGIQSIYGGFIIALLGIIIWMFKRGLNQYIENDKVEKEKIAKTMEEISNKLNELKIKIVEEYIMDLKSRITENSTKIKNIEGQIFNNSNIDRRKE